jgi:tryptophan synthase beta chain
VAAFQSVIGEEAKRQFLEQSGTELPDLALACVGGGSNAIGLFRAFLPNQQVALIGVEAGGRGSQPGEHAARWLGGREGVLHGCRTLVLSDEHGQIQGTHSISAGLDYPAVGPEHADLSDQGRARYEVAGDAEALAGFQALGRFEGILPALESSHALGWLMTHRDDWQGKRVVLGLSGRGDKDLVTLLPLLGGDA